MRRVLVVIAKAPEPGRSKTRLCPPCSPTQAAAVAEAALLDVLDVVRATPCDRRVLLLDGAPAPWAEGFEVLTQRDGGLDERLAGGFEDVGEAAVILGMDTPQLRSEQLTAACDALASPDVDAVYGPAADGGYWSIGLRRSARAALAGVPMSVPETGRAQLARLDELGLRTQLLDELVDVDHWADAVAVAQQAADGRFGRLVRSIADELAASGALRPGSDR